jgi:hypothetical protein
VARSPLRSQSGSRRRQDLDDLLPVRRLEALDLKDHSQQLFLPLAEGLGEKAAADLALQLLLALLQRGQVLGKAGAARLGKAHVRSGLAGCNARCRGEENGEREEPPEHVQTPQT